MSAGEAGRRELPAEPAMRVGVLVALLRECDEDAEVRIMSQQG